MMSDVAVISLHEKGFWQADLYKGFDLPTLLATEAETPDHFKTFKVGGTDKDAEGWVRTNWPSAEIVVDHGDEDDEDDSE